MTKEWIIDASIWLKM